jgi:preprotein translocase subunit SecE
MDIRLYLKESYDELINHVTWPTWDELFSSARLVLYLLSLFHWSFSFLILLQIILLSLFTNFKFMIQIILRCQKIKNGTH